MKVKFISDTKNIGALLDAMNALQERNKALPGLGLICGKAGMGKTEAAKWYAVQTGCIYLRALSVWSQRVMLQEICSKLGHDPEGSIANMYKQIKSELLSSTQLIIVDETDKLVESRKWNLLEILRDLHDETGSSFVFIGEANIKNRLAKKHRLWSRISQIVEFKAISAKEIAFLAHELADLNISDEVAERAVTVTGGDFRDVMVTIASLERVARGNRTDKISKKMIDLVARTVLKERV